MGQYLVEAKDYEIGDSLEEAGFVRYNTSRDRTEVLEVRGVKCFFSDNTGFDQMWEYAPAGSSAEQRAIAIVTTAPGAAAMEQSSIMMMADPDSISYVGALVNQFILLQNGAFSSLGSFELDQDSGKFYYLKSFATGGEAKLKIWEHDEDEPENYSLEVENSGILSEGTTGFAFDSTSFAVAAIGFGTDGDEAPIPELPPAGPPAPQNRATTEITPTSAKISWDAP